VIVIDALDKCGSLRHDLSTKNDYKDLLYILKHWIQVDHLKKFKLIITSQLEDLIIKMFSDSISTHVNILSGSKVKLEDSTSNNIYIFLKLQFDIMEVESGWTVKALDYLVSCTTGIFIWTTIYYNSKTLEWVNKKNLILELTQENLIKNSV